YGALIEEHRPAVQSLAENVANEKYAQLLQANGLTPEAAESLGIEKPAVYLLGRAENAGYASFENDTGIIGGVANIFPVFFLAIAVLVCTTTMSRMVDEERTQIGALKALGFGRRSIMAKYLLYAALATLIGWTVGFFLCTWALPKIFWLAYNEIYNFAPIDYLFSPSLALITLAVSLISILLTTYLSCRKELAEAPASLIRPRAGKVGKRVLPERIKPLWNRLSFLHKITLRNMFHYKRRMIMMLVGIGCCAGLLVTGFGVRDSMIDVGRIQYNEIQQYQLEVGYEEKDSLSAASSVKSLPQVDACLPVRTDFVELHGSASMSSVRLVSYDDADGFRSYWQLTQNGKALSLPSVGEVLVSPKIVEKLSLSAADTLEIRNAAMQSATVTVAGVFDNHVYDYVLMSSETYGQAFGDRMDNTLLIKTDAAPESLAKELTELDAITTVNALQNMEHNISEALNCLNYIIWLIVFFSAALAFIVIFNLTNINIAERRREIATVQVLGFRPHETKSFVLSENLVLSVIASLLGLPLGKLFHMTVMSMVKIDLVHFGNNIEPQSYLLSFVMSVLFAVIVNGVMKRQIEKVNMAESLKAVE
ncbi:MAG: ABC transporter permease, partial [Ruminococcaceae bacterium]|nr:ABC transporter permease [Oscillospiraceae bacterium]